MPKWFRNWSDQTKWLTLLLIALPVNWFVKIGENHAYSSGLFIDYLIGKLYLSDVVLVLWALWWIWAQRSKLKNYFFHAFSQKKNLVLAVLLMLLSIGQVTSPRPILALGLLLKVTLIAYFAWWLHTHRAKLTSRVIGVVLTISLLLQLALGSYQFLTQRSLAGYWLAGEPSLSIPVGLAKEVVLRQVKVLAYGTTPHPNVLAGFAVLSGWTIVSLLGKRSRLLTVIISALMIWSIWITQSLSGGVSLLLIALVSFVKPSLAQLRLAALAILIGIPLLLWLVPRVEQSNSWNRRAELQQLAFHGFSQKALTGVGLGQSATLATLHPLNQDLSRFAQPPHHAGWVLLSETGILGIAVLGALLWKQRTSVNTSTWKKILVLSPLLAWDHYLVTLQIGWLLWILLFLWQDDERTT